MPIELLYASLKTHIRDFIKSEWSAFLLLVNTLRSFQLFIFRFLNANFHNQNFYI